MPAADHDVCAVTDASKGVATPDDARAGTRNALSRHHEALLAFGRRTTAQPALKVLIQDAAMLVGETLDADLLSVAEVGADSRIALRVATTRNARSETVSEVHESSLDGFDSMAAYALASARPVVSTDLAAETRFDDLFLRNLGVVSGVAIPLHLNGRPFGALGVYTLRPREFTADEIGFAETVGHLLSASSARVKLEEDLRRERAVNSTVLEMVNAMVLTLSADGNVVFMNRECERVTGYTLDEVRGRSFWSLFVAPEEADLMRGVFRKSVGNSVPSEIAGFLLNKQGGRKRVSWSMKAMANGQIQTVLMTGVDQTQTFEMKAELEKVRELARRAAKIVQEHTEREAAGRGAAPQGATAQRSGPAGRELRSSPRRDYRYRQKIAPMVDGLRPSKRSFFEVVCRDISAGGISFYMNRLPDFDTLVLALGNEPAVSHFTARVMRVARVEEEGRIRYLVGCRFLGRINL
ncbi:MAG: PAS domain S-box protein [Thermoguttaceae bacterium]|jgi:PAS domain S-box-containing protein|nr:PAS domain S-box protein [Thermoguttaceae bacterium]